MLKAQGILPQSPSPSPPNNLPGPSVKVEGWKDKGKGVKREREENGSGDVIEIVSDDDLDSLQVIYTTSPAFQKLTKSKSRMNLNGFRIESQERRRRNL